MHSLPQYRKKTQKMARKLKSRTLWDFSTSILLQNLKTLEVETLWGQLKTFEKKTENENLKSYSAENRKKEGCKSFDKKIDWRDLLETLKKFKKNL